MDHPLKGRWIVHGYGGDRPWQTASDLPEAEARALFAASGRKSGSKDKDTYYEDRIAVEAWDRTAHLARGGKVDHANPVYAMLSDTPDHQLMANRRALIAVPAESVPAEYLSCSFGDSFPNWYAAEAQRKTNAGLASLVGKTYSAHDFAAHAGDGPLPVEWPDGSLPNMGDFYPEVRIYTRNLPRSSPLALPAIQPIIVLKPKQNSPAMKPGC